MTPDKVRLFCQNIPIYWFELLVEVLDENRTLPVKDGVFEDSFDDWDVHLYRGRSGKR